jgi:hypothetical protein
MTVSWLFLPAIVVAVLMTTVTAAFAQTPQVPPPQPAPGTATGARPYRGVFGSGVDNREQTLTLAGSFGAGYESDFLSALVGSDQPRQQNGGVVGIGSATMAYSLGRPRASVGATLNASTFYYDRAGSQVIHTQSGSATQSLQIARYTRLTARQQVTRQPFRLDQLFPGANEFSFGAPASLPTDSFAGDETNVDIGADVDLSQQVSERVSMTGGYTYQSSQWAASSHRTLQGGRFGVGVGIGRGLSMRLGYGYYRASYRDEESRAVQHHNIDAGVDYSGALSLSRRTTLSFSTGSTAIRDRQQTHFRLTGRARLERQIGRSWVAALAYTRDAYYLDRLSEVVFSDSVNFSVGGLISRRVSFRSGIGAALGDVGFGAGVNGTHSTFGIAGLTMALNRLAAIGLDYNYYLHSFGTDIGLPDDVQREVDRHSVRAYVTVWAPLMARERSQNASR